MSTSRIALLSGLLLATVACGSPPADPSANKQANQKAPAKAAEPAKAPEPAAKPVEPPPAEEPPPTEPEPPVEAAADAGTEAGAEAGAEAGEEAGAEADAPPVEANPSGGWKAPPGVDVRSDAAIPPGTPAANAEAFKRLPAAKADGAPVSAIGTNGIHFDVMVVGRGWEKSRCVEATDTFTVDVDDRVNICLRIVHPADAEETLTVEWNKNGAKSTRRSTVTVKAMHAYLTRSYLPIHANYEGDWTATIKTADGVVLATLPFTVK